MDCIADCGTLATNTTVEGTKQELFLPSTQSETESGSTVLLQLLEFKTHLLEAVEELHIQRDAETRFEDQLSKLVLERQELEWEKESLQQQIETASNQHRDSLTDFKKQFQAKIRNIEEEKGKFQVSAQLKDKEINNLKEELKSLQLLKYNLEKKSSELEQKLALQSRSKDSHLNQLVEVEKRFNALSRQCATVKQAHEKLVQNVDEAMRINKKLTSANEKQETTIVSLKKELEEVSKQLIKAKFTSVRQDRIHSPTGKDQQLQQKLNTETEMNRKLMEENVAVRAEKQEVVRSLQRAQHLLLRQTEAVSRVELELQTQRDQYQVLKQEHEVMVEKSKAVEDKVAQLMESYTASKTSWDQEKTMFLNHFKSEQQERQAVKEAYDELHQKHVELSSQAKVQVQQTLELKVGDGCQGLSVSTQGIRTIVDDVSAEKPLSEPYSFGSLQHLSSSQTKGPGCLQDTGVVTKLDAAGATGEEEALISVSKILTISKDSGVSSTTGVTGSNHRSADGSVGIVSKDSSEEGNERKHEGNDDGKHQKNQKKEEKNTEELWKREEVLGGGNAGEKRVLLMSHTTDRADRQENAGDTRNAETERVGAGGEATGTDQRKKTALHRSGTPETQISAQMTADTAVEKSSTQQVIDLVNIEPSGCSLSCSTKVTVNYADFSHVNKGCAISTEEKLVHTLSSDHAQSVSHGPDFVLQEVQNLSQDGTQTQNTESHNQQPSQIHQVSEKITEDKLCEPDFHTKLSEPLNQSSPCGTWTNTALVVQIEREERKAAQTVPGHLSDINVKQAEDVCDVHMKTLIEPQQDQEISEENQRKSLVTDDSSANKKSGGKKPNCAHKTVREPLENLKSVCVDFIDESEHLQKGKIEGYETKSETESKLCVQPFQDNDESTETGRSKCYKQLPPTENLLDQTDESFVPIVNTYSSSFDWCSAQRKLSVSRKLSEIATLNQGSEQLSWTDGNLRRPPSTITMFLKNKHSKVPLVITRTSDLLNASSVSGTAASSRRPQPVEWKTMESRACLSMSCFPVSTSSNTASRVSRQATPACSRAPTSAAGLLSEPDWEPSCSLEREDQQSSLKSQISKIEQFLNAERLCLPKRRKTDN